MLKFLSKKFNNNKNQNYGNFSYNNNNAKGINPFW